MIRCKLSDLEQRCRERGYTMDAVRPCIASEEGEHIVVDETHASYPHPRLGVGAHLRALLKDWLGIESTPTCSCNAMARKMDERGPEWCKSDEGMAEILGVMRTEHAKRNTILPWSDIAARQLVLLACRRVAR
jgi:hypothetical protein